MRVNLSDAVSVTLVSTEQLNHAARHRNVYYDMVGGDPYGKKESGGNSHMIRSVMSVRNQN